MMLPSVRSYAIRNVQDYLPVVEHAHVAVNQGFGALLDGLHDSRVIVAQGAAHLP